MEKQLLQASEYVARRYFSIYREKFLAHSIDKDDLIQEANIAAWKTSEKYKDKPLKELRTLVNLSAGWRMQRILFGLRGSILSLEDQKEAKEKEIEEQKEQEYLTVDDIDTGVLDDIASFSFFSFNEELLTHNMDSEEYTSKYCFEEFKKVCSPTEYAILQQRFIEGKKLKEIAESLNYTEARISQILRNTLIRLRKIIFTI
jgi:RNA polymerase sigma factor (sigma-70 family)